MSGKELTKTIMLGTKDASKKIKAGTKTFPKRNREETILLPRIIESKAFAPQKTEGERSQINGNVNEWQFPQGSSFSKSKLSRNGQTSNSWHKKDRVKVGNPKTLSCSNTPELIVKGKSIEIGSRLNPKKTLQSNLSRLYSQSASLLKVPYLPTSSKLLFDIQKRSSGNLPEPERSNKKVPSPLCHSKMSIDSTAGVFSLSSRPPTVLSDHSDMYTF